MIFLELKEYYKEQGWFGRIQMVFLYIIYASVLIKHNIMFV